MPTWMLMDDEPDIYEVCLAMFELWSIDGLAFVDGHEAMDWIDEVDQELFDGELPELALLDIRVPGPNGIEVAKRLRRSPRLQSMAIVLTTAFKYTDEQQAQVIAEAGADLLLFMPLPPFRTLQTRLLDLVERRKQLTG